MKKIILFILSFILISIAGFSQHVKDMNGSYEITNNLYVLDSVGIGTNSPTELLEVNGTSLFDDTLFLSSTDYMYENASSSIALQTDKHVYLYTGTGEYDFSPLSTTFIYNTGNQFIFSPSTIRNTDGGLNYGSLKFPVVTSGIEWTLPDTTGTIALLDDISDSTYFYRTDGHIYPTTLTDSVGIGTATPSLNLEVSGNSYFDGYINVIDSLGLNSEYVSAFTYLDSITSNIGNVVTGVPNIYVDTVTVTYIYQTQISASLTDEEPTAAEINTATGLTPATAGAGYQVTIKDSDGTGLLYRIESDGTDWFYYELEKAI